MPATMYRRATRNPQAILTVWANKTPANASPHTRGFFRSTFLLRDGQADPPVDADSPKEAPRKSLSPDEQMWIGEEEKVRLRVMKRNLYTSRQNLEYLGRVLERLQAGDAIPQFVHGVEMGKEDKRIATDFARVKTSYANAMKSHVHVERHM